MDYISKRNLYRSYYRGCKEIDIILGNFAKENMIYLTTEEVEIFNQLLEENDQDIYQWIVQSISCTNQFRGIINKIREFTMNCRKVF